MGVEDDPLADLYDIAYCKHAVSIDFGTTNSVISWLNPKSGLPEVIRNLHGEEKTPSIVYRGTNETLVGKPALDQLSDVSHMDEEEWLDVLGRTFVSVKRLLKDNLPMALPDGQTVKPVDLASDILFELKQSAENGCFNGERVTMATITHPVKFGKKQVANLREAAFLAGFDEIRLMEEPIAAIHGYAASGARTGDGILVFDFGGGTLDLAYLRKADDGEWYMPVPPSGEELGGDDFDRLIYDLCERELKQKHGVSFGLNGSHNLAILHQCRLVKEKLSSQTKARFSHLMPASNLSMRFELDRSGLEALIENDVLKAGQLAQQMIERVGESGHEVDSIILIGGATRMPVIQETLKSKLPVKPMATMHADVAVAMGGSADLDHGLGRQSYDVFVRTVKSMGIAIQHGDVSTIRQCFRAGLAIDAYISHEGLSGPLLLHASRWGQLAACNWLISNGIDIMRSNKARETPLHYAAYYGHHEIIQLLLSKKHDPNCRDRNMNTPLHFAAFCDNADAIHALLCGGAFIDALNARLYTPLHVAAAAGNEVASQMLVKRGASLNARTAWKKIPLHLARNAGMRDTTFLKCMEEGRKFRRSSVFTSEQYLAAKEGRLQNAQANF
jgi:actin-like ATPase involved in cell morphogenesis